MLGKLNDNEVDNLLLSQSVGRIGYTNGKEPFITPVTYTYDGEKIIGQTSEGMKMDIIRENPMVCFEVDIMSGMDNWKSVLVSGTFQELTGEKSDKAREYLFNQVLTLMTSCSIHQHQHEVTGIVDDTNRVKPIMYQINITKKTGRFQKQ